MSKDPVISERVLPWMSRVTPNEGEYGIEIETEVKTPEDYPEDFLKVVTDDVGKKFFKTPKLKKWVGHFDNSLRNYGVEFVFSKAYSFKDSLAALDEFGAQTKDIPFIENAPSTSVHVHWNVFNETFMTMANFLALYALYENLLISYCGPLRRSNLFALPIRVAEKTSDNIVEILKNLNRGNTRGMILQDYAAKYGALNLSSLNKLGSLEIRSMRGTTDIKEIKEWLSIINQMVIYSRTSGLTPAKIADTYRDDAPELLFMTFGPYCDVLKKAAESDPEHGAEYLVEKNLWYLKQVAESVPSADWAKFNSCMDESFKSYQELTKPTRKKKISSVGGDFWGTLHVGAPAQNTANTISQYAHALNQLAAGQNNGQQIMDAPAGQPLTIETQPMHALQEATPVDPVEWDDWEEPETEDTW